NVRVIAATNKDLAEIVRNRGFRQDLYYRLNVMNITIPPLRERREDIPELSRYFLKKYSQNLSKNVSGFTQAALEILTNYQWPGNVRELENVIERSVILCDSEEIGREELSAAAFSSSTEKGYRPSAEELSLEEMEKNHIPKALEAARGNLSKASQLLGIDRKTLYLKMKKYGIEAGKKAATGEEDF
ncbi:MAG TPA: helix-turn-helix domain-containing protein, partial [Thermodesulfovibrionales bacterium]|nr:helix-turn-helix domain-containing protein [Thermodesulfovibrionales bacterium]